MFAKKIVKKLFAMLITQIRKELTIQKPTPEQVRAHMSRPETYNDRIFRKGMNGFAGLAVVAIVVGAMVFL